MVHGLGALSDDQLIHPLRSHAFPWDRLCGRTRHGDVVSDILNTTICRWEEEIREGMDEFIIYLTPTVSFLPGCELRPSSARSDNAPSSALGEIDPGTSVYEAARHR